MLRCEQVYQGIRITENGQIMEKHWRERDSRLTDSTIANIKVSKEAATIPINRTLAYTLNAWCIQIATSSIQYGHWLNGECHSD